MSINNNNSMANQSLILKNAISSLRIGLEDYELSKKDPDRILSSIRNVYASLLLFLKEGLCRLSPLVPGEEFIKAKLEPILKSDGTLGVIGVENKTIDVEGIQRRYKLLNVDIAWGPLLSIKEERNNIEHFYSTSEITVLQSVICQASNFIIEILKTVFNTDPSSLLGPVWDQMSTIANIYEPIRQKCLESLTNLTKRSLIPDFSISLIEEFSCSECGSKLLYLDTGYKGPSRRARINLNNPNKCELVCFACHARIPLYEAFETFANDNYEFSYQHFKYGGSPFVRTCYECGHDTFIEDSNTNSCIFCGYEKGYKICQECGTSLSIEEQGNNGFCFDCYNKYQKSLEDD